MGRKAAEVVWRYRLEVAIVSTRILAVTTAGYLCARFDG